MDKGDLLILSLPCLLFIGCFLPICLFANLGVNTTTGVVVSTTYNSFPYPCTSVRFVYSVPSGTILEDIFQRNYAGDVELELGQQYRITAEKSLFELNPRIISIEKVS